MQKKQVGRGLWVCIAKLIKSGCLWGVGWDQKEKRRANLTNYFT